jgi:ferritin-like metal-binding protein YciE
MSLNNLDDLFMQQLTDLYSAEQQIMDALPKMAKAAHTPELRDALTQHLEQTRVQAERLESIFNSVGAKPKHHKCKGMEGIIDEGSEVLHEKGDSAVIDAAIIASAQRVEHYEIAGYGCARTYAEELGYRDAADLLQETLEEEAQTNERLTQLAEGNINLRAEEGFDTERGR